MGLLTAMFGTYSSRELKRIKPILNKVLQYEDEYKALTDEQLKAKTPEFKERYKNGESLDSYFQCVISLCRLLVVLFFIREELPK